MKFNRWRVGCKFSIRWCTAGRSVSITEIAAELQIDKSSASRLVKTLVSYGYMQPEPANAPIYGRQTSAIKSAGR